MNVCDIKKIKVRDSYGFVSSLGDDMHDVIVFDPCEYNRLCSLIPRYECGVLYHLLSFDRENMCVRRCYRGRKVFTIPSSVYFRFVNPYEG